MRKLQTLFKLDQLSIFILVLPYLAFSIPFFAQSPFITIPKLLGTLGLILLADTMVKLSLKRYPSTTIWVSWAIYVGVVMVLYSAYLVLPVAFFLQKHVYAFKVRGRYLCLAVFFIITLIVWLTRRKNKTFNHVVNIFMLVLFAMNLFINTANLSDKNIGQTGCTANPAKIRFDGHDSLTKPIILIITDEYSSPDELYKIYKDSSLYDFSKKLRNSGWSVKNKSLSHDTSTIHSLSSLFNFNLSESGKYMFASVSEASMNLLHNSLCDSLEKKHIGIINFGIMDLNEAKPLNRLYPYPKSYAEAFLYNSGLAVINKCTNSMKPNGFREDFDVIANHNKRILETLKDSLDRLPSNNYFVYTHLFMPHLPFSYFAEANQPETTDGYLAYWKFTNKKVEQLVGDLQQTNKYRIILTGDHGYREEKNIDSRFTATEFLGFEDKDLEKINSVQDLGYLINGYMN